MLLNLWVAQNALTALLGLGSQADRARWARDRRRFAKARLRLVAMPAADRWERGSGDEVS